MLDQQGFTVSAKSVKDGAKTTSNQVYVHGTKPAVSGKMHVNAKGELIAQDIVGATRPHQEQSDDRAIAHAQKIERTADKLWTAEMFAMFGGMGLGWVANKTKNDTFRVGVKRFLVSPFEALRETKIGAPQELRANYMQSVADNARTLAKDSTSGLAATMADNAEIKAAAFRESGDRFAANVQNKTAPVLNPVKDGIRNGLNAFETTGIGKHVLKASQKFASWRADAVTAKEIKHLHTACDRATQKVPGFFGFIDNIKHAIMGTKPAQIAEHEGLSGISTSLNNARNTMNRAERLAHLEEAKALAKKAMQTGNEEVASRAGHMLSSIEKSLSASGMAHHFEAAEKQGLAGIAKAAGKAVGRVSIFGAIMGVGMTAGLSAIAMSHRRDNKMAKQARNEIASAIGEDSALMQSIDASYHKNKGNHLFKSGLNSVSTVANGMMAASSTAGGMGYMAASMLPASISALVKEDVTLNAYANLRREETHGTKLPADAKLAIIRQLVASVPAVAKAGGIYNRLTMPVSEAILDQNLSARDTMRLLANENQFSELATQVLEKQKALKEAVATAAPEAKPTSPHAEKADKGVVSMTHSPTAKLSHVAHEGRVVSLHRAAAV